MPVKRYWVRIWKYSCFAAVVVYKKDYLAMFRCAGEKSIQFPVLYRRRRNDHLTLSAEFTS